LEKENHSLLNSSFENRSICRETPRSSS
jgi:hypothetical protein